MASESRRIHLLSGLIVLFTFLAGAAVGAGVQSQLRPHRGPPGMRGPPMYLRELSLTPEQTKAADVLFEKHRTTIEAMMREHFPKVREVNDQLETELRALLTPDQVKKLDELRARRGPPPPPPP